MTPGELAFSLIRRRRELARPACLGYGFSLRWPTGNGTPLPKLVPELQGQGPRSA
jgi:hypothetical protein